MRSQLETAGKRWVCMYCCCLYGTRMHRGPEISQLCVAESGSTSRAAPVRSRGPVLTSPRRSYAQCFLYSTWRLRSDMVTEEAKREFQPLAFNSSPLRYNALATPQVLLAKGPISGTERFKIVSMQREHTILNGTYISSEHVSHAGRRLGCMRTTHFRVRGV